MSYKQIDRSVHKGRDLVLADGQAYNEYQDPHYLAAKQMWADMQQYELVGAECHNRAHLKTSIHNLA